MDSSINMNNNWYLDFHCNF